MADGTVKALVMLLIRIIDPLVVEHSYGYTILIGTSSSFSIGI